MSRPIGLMDVKQALRDRRFRESLPSEFQADIQKYMQNPGCTCNVPIYKRLMTEAKGKLQEYFPNRSVANLENEAKKLQDNTFSVINCHVDELEGRLKKLPPGRKQISVARHLDQATVIVNELDVMP